MPKLAPILAFLAFASSTPLRKLGVEEVNVRKAVMAANLSMLMSDHYEKYRCFYRDSYRSSCNDKRYQSNAFPLVDGPNPVLKTRGGFQCVSADISN